MRLFGVIDNSPKGVRTQGHSLRRSLKSLGQRLVRYGYNSIARVVSGLQDFANLELVRDGNGAGVCADPQTDQRNRPGSHTLSNE